MSTEIKAKPTVSKMNQPQLNLNTLLSLLIAGLMAWIGNNTWQNARDLAVVSNSMKTIESRISESGQDVREKMNDIKSTETSLTVRVTALEVSIGSILRNENYSTSPRK